MNFQKVPAKSKTARIHVAIYNSPGQLLSMQKEQHEYVIDMHDQPTGIYLVVVEGRWKFKVTKY